MALDHRYWQDPRDEDMWRVIARAETQLSLSQVDGENTGETSVMLVFDELRHQHVASWSEPEPLQEVSDEEFPALLAKAKKESP